MRIGGYYIKGISKRFWLILVAALFLIFMLITMWPKSADPLSAWNNGEVSMAADLEAGLTSSELLEEICPSGSNCIEALDDPSPALEEGGNMMRAFRLRVYVPDENLEMTTGKTLFDERKSLFSQKFEGQGWQFRPAVIFGYDGIDSAALTQEGDVTAFADLASESFEAGGDSQLGTGDIVLGLDGENQDIAPGLYDVDGVLFGTSTAISLDPEKLRAQYQAFPSPVLLVTGYRSVSAEEALNAAEQTVDIGIAYQVGPGYRIHLDQLEWPGGGDAPRLCLALRNTSERTLEVWEGFQGITLNVDAQEQAATLSTDLTAFTNNNAIQPGSPPAAGYITFAPEDAASLDVFSGSIRSKKVALGIPSLDSRAQDPDQTTIQLSGDGQRNAMPVTESQSQGPQALVSPLGAPSLCG